MHLPDGPTAHFKLSSIKLSKQIKVIYCHLFCAYKSLIDLVVCSCACIFSPCGFLVLLNFHPPYNDSIFCEHSVPWVQYVSYNMASSIKSVRQRTWSGNFFE